MINQGSGLAQAMGGMAMEKESKFSSLWLNKGLFR